MAQLICIVCPKGCHLTVDELTLAVTGNSCEKGEEYGKAELTAPTRVLTSTVCVNSDTQRRCPVKTNGAIPKGDIMRAMHLLDTVCLNTPIHTGDIVIKNILNSDISFVATKDIL
ncbi:MAG: DUF1667 domain-containing protein [Oscillospiraceae bacterium]